ncbi:hypothetical protein EYR40_001257 [Pleurotus pulmonarius]|nr:hypothetical protein EYR36_000395 [Pleurotus pulmonarius]KAF4604074.1 hypothetical protein EYR38_004496 [Pleurotus pulmonarius]KAF4608904.1 hypothetical protein EYR40_001257 [Pleurotus pulmonarius]
MASTTRDAANQEAYELLLPSGQEDTSKQGETMGKEEQMLKPEGRPGDGLAKLAGLISAAVFLLVTWYAELSNDPKQHGWFALHPLLQSFSIALITYGILTLQPTSQPKTKAAGFARHHLAIFFIAFPSITVGTFAVWYNKHLNGRDHFLSWHGTLGITCMLWIIFQVLLGGGSVWFGGKAFGGGMKAKLLWRYHRLSGYLLFPLLLFTAYLGGARSGWATRNTSMGQRLVGYIIAPAVILGAVYARIRLSKMKFF